ncbi:MAG: AAA family ATPase [Desulfobacterales bacterium]
MYLEHFGLRRLPFENTPDPAFFFMGSRYRDILALLMHGTVSRKGLMCITGPVGSGKTMLSIALAEHVPDQTRIIRISHPSAAREELLPFIADSLEIPVPVSGTLMLTEKIRENLTWLNEEGKQCLLIIDEAHLIRKEVFQEILVLSNLETPEFKLLQILLLGQKELGHTLARPDMRQLMQRLAVSASLDPMNREQSLRYIAHRLKVAGGSPDIFSPGVADAFIRVSGGIPRNINKLCDASLLNAFVAGHPKVTESDFRKALENLGFHFSRSAQIPIVPEPVPSPVSPDSDRKEEDTGSTEKQDADAELTGPSSGRAENRQHAEKDGEKTSASCEDQQNMPGIPDREQTEKKQTSPLFFRFVLSLALVLALAVFFMNYRNRQEPVFREQAAQNIPSQITEIKEKKENLPQHVQDSSALQKQDPPHPAVQESTAMPTDSGEAEKLETAPAAPETAFLPAPEQLSEKKEEISLSGIDPAEADLQSFPLQWDEENINEEEESTDLEKYPYSVQLASFRTWERTEEALASYKKKGIPAYWVKMKADEGGLRFCIFAGIFEKQQDAERFISSRNAEGALAVRTPYAGLVKTFPSTPEASEYAALLAEKGHSCYVIARNDGRHYLYAGAFRTPEGAEQQCRELISKNIDCRAVTR